MQRPRRLSRRALLLGGAPLLAGGLSVLAGCNDRSDDTGDRSPAEVTPATVPESGRERLFAIYTADLPSYDPPTLVSDDHLRSRFERLESLVETVDDFLASTETPEADATTTAERASASTEGTTTPTATERTTNTATETTTNTATETTTNTATETTTVSGGRPGSRRPPLAEVRADARRLVSDASELLDRADGPSERWELPADGAVSGRLIAIRGANHFVRALTKRWWWLRESADRANPSALARPDAVQRRRESFERSLHYRCVGTGVALPYYARTEDAVGEASVNLAVWRNVLDAAQNDGEGAGLGEQAFYAVGADLALADANAYQESLRARGDAPWPCGPTIERTYATVRPRLESKLAEFESRLADHRDRGGNEGGPSETTAFGHARAELLRESPAATGQLARADELLAAGRAATALTRLATLLVRSHGAERALGTLPSESVETEALRHRAADAREDAATRLVVVTGRIDRENLFARGLLGEAIEAVERGHDAVAYTVEQRTVTDDGRTELAEAVAQYALAGGIAEAAPGVARLAQPTRD